MGFFGSRRQQPRGPEAFIPQSGEARRTLVTQALLHFAVLHGRVSSDTYPTDELIQQHRVSADVLGLFSPQELAGSIVQTGMVEYLRGETQRDPSLEHAVEVFEALVASVAAGSDRFDERGKAQIHEVLVSRLPLAARAAAVTALAAVMAGGSVLPAAAQTTEGSDGTSIYFDGTSQATTVAEPTQPNTSDTDDMVLVYGNDSGEVASPEAASSWGEPANELDGSSMYFEPETPTLGQPLIVQAPESRSSEIADLLGFQAPDVFEIPSLRDSSSPELDTVKKGLHLKALSYNILGVRAAKIYDNGGKNSWRDRLAAAVSVVKQANPDIMGFQEVDDIQYGLNKALSDEYDTYPAKRSPGSNRMMTWRASDYELVDSGMYGVERYRTKNAQFPWVKLRVRETGEEFLMTNMHTTAGAANNKSNVSRDGLTPPEQRAEQAEKLLSELDEINEENLPVIIFGDLNSTCEKTGRDKGVPLEKIPCRMLYSAGYQDAGLVASAKGEADNYNWSTSHGSAGARRKQNGRHIDHVMVSEGIEIRGWKNIINELSRRASDHTPVQAEAFIPSPGSVDQY